MKIIIDNRAGFCGGVKRVIKMAEDIMEKEGTVLSLGEIIHNHSESDRLQKKGMEVVDYDIFNDPDHYRDKTILIRAHGTPESTLIKAAQLDLKIADGTCPVVTRSQNFAKEFYEKGYQIVIIGKEKHPEVLGIQGRCENRAIVVYHDEDLEKIDYSRKTFVLSQTTVPQELFESFVKKMRDKMPDLEVKDTICRFVLGRDRQLKEFVEQCDKIIMVGGRHSSNTKWLYGVCMEINPNTYWIEEKEEIQMEWFSGDDCVGITGSASTPQWLLEEVKNFLEEKIGKWN